MSQMIWPGDTSKCQPQRGAGGIGEGGERCLPQSKRGPRPGGAGMDDAAGPPVPGARAAPQEASTQGQIPAGISTVEYAMVYQAESPGSCAT
jgi:hypothetical protein